MVKSNPSLGINSADVPAAIEELFGFEEFVAGVRDFLPKDLFDTIIKNKEEVKSSDDFQKHLIYPLLKWIEEVSIEKLSKSGLMRLSSNEKYLFITNHRDIVLDSAYLNLVLFENEFTTSQIAIGDNLMKHRVSELLFLINKSFVVKRTGTARELYQHSINLSTYIHNCIINKTDSIWIAQREGRAKDGNDRTQVALLKMLSLSGRKNLKQHLLELNIVPVSINYEKDPCDLLKTLEYLQKQKDPNYKKSFKEDVNYMLKGVEGQKGKLHFHFGKPLKEKLEQLDALPTEKEQLEQLAKIIDGVIHQNYDLQAINYCAYDLLHSTQQYASKCDPIEKEQALAYLNSKLNQLPKDNYEAAKAYFLGIYANPLKNQLGLS